MYVILHLQYSVSNHILSHNTTVYWLLAIDYWLQTTNLRMTWCWSSSWWESAAGPSLWASSAPPWVPASCWGHHTESRCRPWPAGRRSRRRWHSPHTSSAGWWSWTSCHRGHSERRPGLEQPHVLLSGRKRTHNPWDPLGRNWTEMIKLQTSKVTRETGHSWKYTAEILFFLHILEFNTIVSLCFSTNILSNLR